MSIRLLVINPNSTESITDGLRDALEPYRPADIHLDYFTGPSHAPTGIRDFRTGVQTAAICFDELEKSGALERYDGFLVCCFTDHPLQHMIREELGPTSPKPCIGMFEAGLSKALMLGRKFGVLSTGFGPKPLLSKGVMNFLGAASSDRWAGGITSGIAIEELRQADVRDKVERLMKETAAKVAEKGADTIIMGCAGMAGMEPLVRAGVSEAGLGEVRVIDAAVAGLVMLAGMVATEKPRA
ncbi:hypothetical protein Rhopal_000658-T1 [Rhodotorula paludigena]|uniref:Hydantoin racemase n=1 Tax=Rhodotorula paludigena TaxID=86838 RepID=A0AAV5GC96_9BASI|nr:hypothetical protein Rhopal_000658-T1 [Rhodotorula paludigena]